MSYRLGVDVGGTFTESIAARGRIGGEIEALRASCLEETGLPAPRQSVWVHTAIAAE